MPALSVVVRDVLYQPFHRVPGVGGFVYAFRVFGIVGRAEHDELALALEAAANVLRNENVVFAAPALARPEALLNRVFGRNSVGRAVDQKGQRTFGIPGREQHGLQTHAIPHGDHDFLIIDEYPGLVALAQQQDRARQSAEQQRPFHAASTRSYTLPPAAIICV